jgi:hypothetical protein
MCVHARRLGDEVKINAKPASASLLADILLEDIYRHSPSSEANSRGESGERPAYQCDITGE